jgi:exportin-T
VGTLLVATRKARGQEALDFFTNVFLPQKGWPQDAVSTFTNQLVTLDTRGFKKYWSEFVRRSLTNAPR